MVCARCRGLMISDSYEDLRDDTHQFRFSAWRCLNCGEVVDSVIVGHRRKTVIETITDSRLSPYHCDSVAAA